MHGMRSPARRREAKLTRQADVEVDDFEHFRALATGRFQPLSGANKPKYGGSLPSFCVDDSFADPDDAEIQSFYPGYKSLSQDKQSSPVSSDYGNPKSSPRLGINSGQLSVPLSPMMQRSNMSGSDCNLDKTLTPASPKSPGRLSPARFFSSVKSMLEECDSKSRSTQANSPAKQQQQQNSGSSSLDVPAVQKCPSAPHSRSNSFKRKKVKDIMARESLQEKSMQERTSSMPIICKDGQRRPSNLPLETTRLHPNSCSDGSKEEWERVRNFVTSPKGILNCGDSFRRSNSSLRSGESWDSEDTGLHGWQRSLSRPEELPVPLHRVLILGGPGVGKTTLAQQFVTSDCLVNVEVIGESSYDTLSVCPMAFQEFEDCLSVSVLLDDQEAKVDILEISFNQDHRQYLEVDAYIVVYGINDRSSFHHSVDLLYRLCKEDFVQNPVILVANKTDLVRAREVAEQEGKSAAVTYNCKYFEVSSLMNLKVDELLAGVLNQIRLRKGGANTDSSHHHHHHRGIKHRMLHHHHNHSPVAHDCSVKSPITMIGRMLRPGMLKRQQSKSCDNLLVL